MKIERFEDIESWKEARNLVKTVYRITEGREFSKDCYLKDQIRRAAVSVMSNIAEGFDRGTDKEFVQFLVIARASASEVKSQLYVALDCQYIDQDKFDEIYQQSTKVISLIDGFIRYLRGSPKSGSRPTS